ncbi:potassium channel family protein [Methanomassiliicoccus luminyensis]|jgi:uncharacterized protein with PhoU and TrkA domain|uniref:potassium channel family protein n=1 Tax=Methanomassiliicoccus luminyensis TaxID=1080712 RepID=UPI00067403CA|nr:TrkA C-terminal domain-containing protein [Methanomassiliicoccus luminyensis]
MADISAGAVTENLQDMFLEIKDTSELMIDLAYSSLLYNNRDIAEEVAQLEARVREMGDELQELSIQGAVQDGDTKRSLLVILLARSVQDISDAALKIANVVRMGQPLHPVVGMSLRESDVIISTAVVEEGSDLAGSTLGAVKLSTNSGMRVIAIRRGRRYIYGPDRHTPIMAGDVLFARGPEDGRRFFKDLAKGLEHLEPKDLQ